LAVGPLEVWVSWFFATEEEEVEVEEEGVEEEEEEEEEETEDADEEEGRRTPTLQPPLRRPLQ